MKKITLGIGGLYASIDREVITTVLGSCVSVCLFDPITRSGGMNHIFLPGNADFNVFNDSARYGINAMELLINEMLSIGARRRSLRAKVFGGGQVLNGNGDKGVFKPGEANIEFTFGFLQTEKIPIDGYNVGGNFARRVELNTYTGEVLMKKIKARFTEDIKVLEQKYRRKVQGQLDKPRRVALFND